MLTRQAEIRPTELLGHLYSFRAGEAARHLLRVTAGLDSMIIGEAEIQGQVKRAYELALVEGATGPILNRLFRGALAAGGRARQETGISEKGVSIPSVAVQFAQRALGDLAERRVLMIGAGATAELVARALHRPRRRHRLRRQPPLRPRDRPGPALQRQRRPARGPTRAADRGRHRRLRHQLAPPRRRARRARRGDGGARRRPLLLIDIAVPRDIEPACREVPGVTVYDIDDVQQIVERNAGGRESEATLAERIIEAELDRFERWLASLEVVPTIAALREHGDEIVRRVMAENENRWQDLNEVDRARMEAMAKAIASRILHEPTLRMRRAAGHDDAYIYVSALRDLFGLDVETEAEAESGAAGQCHQAPPRPELRRAPPWRFASRRAGPCSRGLRRGPSPTCWAGPS